MREVPDFEDIINPVNIAEQKDIEEEEEEKEPLASDQQA